MRPRGDIVKALFLICDQAKMANASQKTPRLLPSQITDVLRASRRAGIPSLPAHRFARPTQDGVCVVGHVGFLLQSGR